MTNDEVKLKFKASLGGEGSPVNFVWWAKFLQYVTFTEVGVAVVGWKLKWFTVLNEILK